MPRKPFILTGYGYLGAVTKAFAIVDGAGSFYLFAYTLKHLREVEIGAAKAGYNNIKYLMAGLLVQGVVSGGIGIRDFIVERKYDKELAKHMRK
jgi:hypothetical protein